jgi:hypothetical protein
MAKKKTPHKFDIPFSVPCGNLKDEENVKVSLITVIWRHRI